MKPIRAMAIILVCVLPAMAAGEEAPLQPAVAEQPATSVGTAPRPPSPAAAPAHPAFYPSERQLFAWLQDGYRAFTEGVAHDVALDVPGVNRWYWLPQDLVPIGSTVAIAGVSCETPQLLATYAAWSGTRVAFPEEQTLDAVYSQLAEQGAYCRFVVTGLAKSNAQGLGLDYVLNVSGRRYGQPIISSSRGELVQVQSPERRDYVYSSVEVVERLDIDYVVADVDGKTIEREQVRSSVGYHARTSVVRRSAPVTEWRYLTIETVDFPLLAADGSPLIPASASEILLEMLGPDTSYNVTVGLARDPSYLTDEPPMTNPLAAVTLTALQRNLSRSQARPASMQRSELRAALEAVVERPEYAEWVVGVRQMDPKVPALSISIRGGRSLREMKKALRALVLEGQKACREGNLVITFEESGRKLLRGEYHPSSKGVMITVIP